MNKFFETLSSYSFGKVGVIALVAAGLYWYMLYDDGSAIDAQISAVSQQLREQESKKADTDNTLKQVREMQEKVGQLTAKYQEISRRLPTDLYSIDINKAIDSFAKASGVSIKLKRPGDNIKKEVVEEVPVDVSVEGTFAQISQFVYVVTSAEKMTRVKNVVISESADGAKRLKLDAQVVGFKLAPEAQKSEQQP